MRLRLSFKYSWLVLSVLILEGCIDLHNINLYEVKISPDGLNALKTSPEIRALHYSAQPLTFYYPSKLAYQCTTFILNNIFPSSYYGSSNCSAAPPKSHLLDFEDPISLIKNHFLHDISTSLAINNVHSIPEAQPRSEDQNRALQESFGNGLLLVFESRIWRLSMDDPRSESEKRTLRDIPETNPTYAFEYVVRGSLIRLEDAKILWRGVCYAELPSLKMDNGPVPSRLQTVMYSSMAPSRELLATKCSKELLKKILRN